MPSSLWNRIIFFLAYSSTPKLCNSAAIQLQNHRQQKQKQLKPLQAVNHNAKRRREVIHSLVLQAAGLTTSNILLPDSKANAIAPLTSTEAEFAPENRFDRMFRPKPPRLLRRKLDQNFAVLLMRSSYNALDELDVVAMDQFQRDFFLLRQAEYEWYTDQVGGAGVVKQGELSDPLYFDFISFAQYATISRELSRDVPAIFEEQQPDPETVDENGLTDKFVKVIVQRDPVLVGKDLKAEHSLRVGASILDQLEATFKETSSALPKIEPGSRPGKISIQKSIEQLVNLFLLNGFALNGKADVISKEEGNGQMVVDISLTSPANLWSGQALQFRKADPTNSFITKAACVLLTRAGFQIKEVKVKYTKSEEVSSITLI